MLDMQKLYVQVNNDKEDIFFVTLVEPEFNVYKLIDSTGMEKPHIYTDTIFKFSHLQIVDDTAFVCGIQLNYPVIRELGKVKRIVPR